MNLSHTSCRIPCAKDHSIVKHWFLSRGKTVLNLVQREKKNAWENEGTDPLISNLNTRWEVCSASFPNRFNPSGENPTHPLDTRLGGPLSWSGRCLKKTIKTISCLCRQQNSDSSVVQLVDYAIRIITQIRGGGGNPRSQLLEFDWGWRSFSRKWQRTLVLQQMYPSFLQALPALDSWLQYIPCSCIINYCLPTQCEKHIYRSCRQHYDLLDDGNCSCITSSTYNLSQQHSLISLPPTAPFTDRARRTPSVSSTDTAVNKVIVFWDVTPCNLIDRYQRFEPHTSIFGV
jgi:hypothetical protein